jgi:hypothetical protein
MIYLQIDFYKYEYLITPIKQFQRVITSPDFFIQNENQLFQAILGRIEKNPEFLSLLQYLHFGIINQRQLNDLITFHQIYCELFHRIRDNFFFNYLTLHEVQHFNFNDYFQLIQENQSIQTDLDYFHQIPINIFSLNNIMIMKIIFNLF